MMIRSGNNVLFHPREAVGAPEWCQCKPLQIVLREEEEEHHESSGRRHFTLFDLVMVGIGSTVGSGIFVLCGFIAHHYAGPATFLSFFISGLAACCSGICYAELAGRIPASGSTYIYAYINIGELAAVVGAACLMLEYGIAGAAVARSWGDKMNRFLVDDWGIGRETSLTSSVWNPMAFVVSFSSMALLMYGVHESKRVSNFFTMLKIGLVVFMVIGGYIMMDAENLKPLAPMGAAGVLRGASSSFFGYLGYDEVCCVAGEAIHPQRDMPRAVMYTLGIVAALYMSASVALVGMQPYELISDSSGFPVAFAYQKSVWASQVAAIGEIVTLPVVVLISLMAQPRLQLALAKDGLLPEIFTRRDQFGNLWWGALISGTIMTLIATFVPFTYLDDLISGGILVAFSMTNSCLILMRHESPRHQPKLLEHSLCWYHALCFVTGLLFCHVWGIHALGKIVCTISLGATAFCATRIGWKCPRREEMIAFGNVPKFGNVHEHVEFFETPLVPYLPCIGICGNWYLVAQLELYGMALLVSYIGLVALAYFACAGLRTHRRGWRVVPEYEIVPDVAAEHSDNVFLRQISLPPLEHDSSQPTAEPAAAS